MPEWLHLLFTRSARVAGYRWVKEAHTEAALDWLRKISHENGIVKAMIEEEAGRNPAIKAALSPKVEHIRRRPKP
jgi:hypothetical protein